MEFIFKTQSFLDERGLPFQCFLKYCIFLEVHLKIKTFWETLQQTTILTHLCLYFEDLVEIRIMEDRALYHQKILNLSRSKLKASSEISSLLSGFAMVAMVEIEIDKEVRQFNNFFICQCFIVGNNVDYPPLRLNT